MRRLSLFILGLLVLASGPTSAADAPKRGRGDACGDPLPEHAHARFGTTRWRQRWSVIGLAYSQDGKQLCATSYEEGFCRFDAASGKRLFRLPIDERSFGLVAPSGDANRVAVSSSNDVNACVYETKTGKQIASLPVDRVAAMTMSGDGQYLATLHAKADTWDSFVCLWDVARGTEARRFKRWGSAVRFGPGHKTLLGGDRKRLRVWDIATGKEQRRLEGRAETFAVSADGKTLATRDDRCITIRDFESGKERLRIPTADDAFPLRYDDLLALSADGSIVAFGGTGYLIAWDSATGKERFRRTQIGWVRALAFPPRGSILTWGCMYQPSIQRWDLETDKDASPCPGHGHYVESLSFTRDGKTLIAQDEMFESAGSQTIRMWDVDSAKETTRLATSNSMVYSPDEKTIAVTGVRDVTLKDRSTGKELHVLKGHRMLGFARPRFSPDGTRLAIADFSDSGDAEGKVHVWDVASGKKFFTVEGNRIHIDDVVFAPDGETFVSGGDLMIRWKAKTGRKLWQYRGGAHRIAISHDSKLLAATTQESVDVYRCEMGEVVATLADKNARSVAFSPTSLWLATGGADGSVRIWNPLKGTEVLRLRGHDGPVRSLAFSPDGKRLASESEDTTILVWDVESALKRKDAETPRKPLP